MATSIDDFCANGFLVVRGAIAPDIAPAPTHDDLLVFYLPDADDWLASFPCFVVSDRLARELKRSSRTGFAPDELEVSTTPEYFPSSIG